MRFGSWGIDVLMRNRAVDVAVRPFAKTEDKRLQFVGHAPGEAFRMSARPAVPTPVKEVRSGQWGIGGTTASTADIKAMASG